MADRARDDDTAQMVWTCEVWRQGFRVDDYLAPSLDAALYFSEDGTESGTYAVLSITQPDGTVLWGDDLHAAELDRFWRLYREEWRP